MEKQHSQTQNEVSVRTQSEKLKIRCPSCVKLYEVDTADIHSDAPQFQCVSCQTRFAFFYPPVQAGKIECFILDAAGQELADVQYQLSGEISIEEAMASDKQKSCPKCGALSPMGAEECYSCHVIFAKLEGLPTDSSLRAQPSLVRKWRTLVDDFNNKNAHKEFVRSCHELEALPFAKSKYEDMRSALGGDSLCEEMIAEISELEKISHKELVRKEQEAAAVFNWKRDWLRYAIYTPFVLSAILVLWGSTSLGHRNLIGIGVAMACLATGIRLSVRKI